MRAIHKILHPTDFSKGAEPATELAIEMARRFDAELTFLHVYGAPVQMGPFGDGYALPPELIQKLQEDTERALQELQRRATQAGVRARTLSTDGNVADSIVSLAGDGMDLIVMGTHGRTGVKHLLLGSVAERILRSAPCPVLTVRESLGRRA